MRRKVLAALALGSVCVVCLVAGAGGDGGQGGTPAFKPVMPVESLMEEQDRHFEAMVDLLRDPSAEDWDHRVRHAALALAEMANVNGYQDLAQREPRYRELAGQLKAQSLRFAELTGGRKVQEARSLAKQINSTCKACHDRFR